MKKILILLVGLYIFFALVNQRPQTLQHRLTNAPQEVYTSPLTQSFLIMMSAWGKVLFGIDDTQKKP